MSNARDVTAVVDASAQTWPFRVSVQTWLLPQLNWLAVDAFRVFPAEVPGLLGRTVWGRRGVHGRRALVPTDTDAARSEVARVLVRLEDDKVGSEHPVQNFLTT